MIAHIVLFTPKPEVAADVVRSFAQSVLDVCGSVPSIQRAMIGKAVAIDPGYQRSMGLTTYKFAAVLEFADREALLDYLKHPKHGTLGRLFWEICESTAVVEVDGRDPGAWKAEELV
jgi:hypothetical protein